MSTLDSRATMRGAVAGLLVIAPLSAVRVVLDRNVTNFDESAWVPLFAVGLLAAYVVAGAGAGRRGADAPMSNGMVAALGALILWLPIRALIWLARETSRGLFTGHRPVFAPGQLLAQMVLAALFGLVGGLIGARLWRGGESAGRPRPGPSSDGDPAEERPDSAGQGAG